MSCVIAPLDAHAAGVAMHVVFGRTHSTDATSVAVKHFLARQQTTLHTTRSCERLVTTAANSFKRLFFTASHAPHKRNIESVHSMVRHCFVVTTTTNKPTPATRRELFEGPCVVLATQHAGAVIRGLHTRLFVLNNHRNQNRNNCIGGRRNRFC
jgi:hypothetical protein